MGVARGLQGNSNFRPEIRSTGGEKGGDCTRALNNLVILTGNLGEIEGNGRVMSNLAGGLPQEALGKDTCRGAGFVIIG